MSGEDTEERPPGQLDPWAGPEWEGHTHDYARPRKDGSQVCRDCGMIMPPDLLPELPPVTVEEDPS